jgi:hypothetical protein
MLALTVSCTQQHEGPQSSDTVTNWLKRCGSHRDCTGAAWCLDAVCTIPCEESRPDACGQARAGLLCDVEQGACDLPCESDRACDLLGSRYSCEAGHCRARGHLVEKMTESSFASASDDTIPEVEDVVSALTVREYDTLPTPRDATFQLSQAGTDNFDLQVYWTGRLFRVTWMEGELRDRLGSADIVPTDSFTSQSVDLPEVGRLVHGRTSQLLLATVSPPSSATKCTVRTLDLDDRRSGFLLTFPCGGRIQAAPTTLSDEWVLSWSRGFPPPGESTEPIAVARYGSSSGSWIDGPRVLAAPPAFGGPDSIVVVGTDVWLDVHPGTVWRIGGLAGVSRPDQPRTDAFVEGEFETFELPGGNLYPNGVIWPVSEGVIALNRRSDTTLQAVPIRSDGTQLPPTEIEGALPFPSVVSLSERDAFALCLTGPSGVSVTLVSNTGQVLGEPVHVDDDPDVLLCDLAWSGRELLVAWRHVPNDGTGLASMLAKILPLP